MQIITTIHARLGIDTDTSEPAPYQLMRRWVPRLDYHVFREERGPREPRVHGRLSRQGAWREFAGRLGPVVVLLSWRDREAAAR